MRTIFLLFVFFGGIVNAQEFRYAEEQPREDLIQHEGFTLSYSEAYELPSWVGYTLTADQAKAYNGEELKGKFTEDPNIPTGSANYKDYKKSGYVIAQFAPAEDFMHNEAAQSETYYLSNAGGQKAAFNKYQWKTLELVIREWAKQSGKLLIVTGPILGKPPYTHIGKNNVVVPDDYFKVIIDIDSNKGIGFIFRNGMSSNPVYKFAVSIDEVEKKAEIDFFPDLSESMEKKIEGAVDIEQWDFSILED